MKKTEILDLISQGRTDLVFDLLRLPDFRDTLQQGHVKVLQLLAFGEHRIGKNTQRFGTSDHGAGWGNGMEWNFVGDFLSESLKNNNNA